MRVSVMVGILCCSLALPALAAKRYYRYENNEGVMVIRDTIPADMVHKGYDILGADGRKLKVVPRSLTPEEIEARRVLEEHQAREAEKKRIQKEADLRLLSLYSTPKDAERARDRQLEALTVAINVNKGNIERMEKELSEASAIAADRERSGVKVPPFVIKKIERLERQIEILETKNQSFFKEQDEVAQKFNADIERLRMLMSLNKPKQDG